MARDCSTSRSSADTTCNPIIMGACISRIAWPPRNWRSKSAYSSLVSRTPILRLHRNAVAAVLGIYGKGQAPRWRLTELGYMKDPPTRDFMRWDGVRFHESQKTKACTENRDGVFRKTGTVVYRKTGTLHGTSVRKTVAKRAAQKCTENGDKSSNHLGGVWVGDNLRGEIPQTDPKGS